MPQTASDKRHFIIVGVLVVITTVIMGVFLNAVLELPEPSVTQAGTVDGLFRIHMWLIAFLSALVLVFMVYSLIVFRRRKRTDDGEHFEGNTMLEILWTAIPLVAVALFSVIGVQTLASVTSTPPDEMVIQVTGRQWSWSFGYPDGVETAELVVPVNQGLTMAMTAEDVIHSFWIPEWRVKQDLVPGLTTEVHFTPDRVGEFTLMCNQACGLSHTIMLAKVRVVTPEEYTAWLDTQLVQQDQQTASR